MKAVPIMIQGTHSDAGKSMMVTALCRIFARKGYAVAPFKSQNMALNSYITIDGREIGRAQGVQAEAAGVEAETMMNPVLIKPTKDDESQIVVHGKPLRNMKASEYRKEYYETAKQVIREAYQSLAGRFDRIVIEGAGSPAEVNLNDRELVNMSIARMADAPVILVGDIDRGGVFASLVGTLQLLDPVDRKRVCGVIINKFRGDVSLLQPGLDWFEAYAGIPVLGVVPFLEDAAMDAEDSLSLHQYSRFPDDAKDLDIAVIHLPRISNFTDIDPFRFETDCHVRLVQKPEELGKPDLIILPGTKNTLEDCQFMKELGLDRAVRRLHLQGTIIFGICGGYQMMGEKIHDPQKVESEAIEVEGIGIFPLKTTMLTEKRTVRSSMKVHFSGEELDIQGYEVHMGRTERTGDVDSFLDGSVSDGAYGTYFHGVFHNDKFRHLFLNQLRKRKGLQEAEAHVLYEQLRLEAYDRLAAHVTGFLDVDRLEDIMEQYQRR